MARLCQSVPRVALRESLRKPMMCRWQSLKDNSDLHLFKAPRDDSKPFRLDPKVTVSLVIIWHGMALAMLQ